MMPRSLLLMGLVLAGLHACESAVAATGKGSFKVVYEPVKSAEYKKLLNDLKSAEALETIAGDLNAAFSIPTDVAITFSECGEPNAFYSPSDQKIVMCFELIERFVEVFEEDAQSDEDLDQALIGATLFVLYHELGHALVDILDLPITGKEEDAVDQLSTLLLVGDEDGQVAALNGARYWYLEYQGNDNELDELQFADEHSMDAQRFYNIICWVYGNDPKQFEYLVENGALPEARAARCPGEFERVDKAWSTLLSPHTK